MCCVFLCLYAYLCVYVYVCIYVSVTLVCVCVCVPLCVCDSEDQNWNIIHAICAPDCKQRLQFCFLIAQSQVITQKVILIES